MKKTLIILLLALLAYAANAQKKIRLEIDPEYLRQYAEDSANFVRICRDPNLDTILCVSYGKDSTEFIEWHTTDNKIIKFKSAPAHFIFGKTAAEHFVLYRYYKTVKEDDLLWAFKRIIVLLDKNLNVIDSRVIAWPIWEYVGDRTRNFVQLDSIFVKIGYETEGHWEPVNPPSKRQKYYIGSIVQRVY